MTPAEWRGFFQVGNFPTSRYRDTEIQRAREDAGQVGKFPTWTENRTTVRVEPGQMSDRKPDQIREEKRREEIVESRKDDSGAGQVRKFPTSSFPLSVVVHPSPLLAGALACGRCRGVPLYRLDRNDRTTTPPGRCPICWTRDGFGGAILA